MARRRRREYLVYLDKAKAAAEMAVDAFNRVNNPYRDETSLILLSNAWELLAKSILIQTHQSIKRGNRGETISAEVAISRLLHRKEIESHESDTVQQIISLRNAATHEYLPELPEEILHHLLFFGCKFFKQIILRKFPSHVRDLDRNYLSISFSEMTTYADRVQKIVSRVKKNKLDKKIVWLLECGLEFDGSFYITENQFERKYRGKSKIMPYLKIGEFIKNNDMVRIVPVEAPRNYTADVSLRKGDARNTSLPVIIKKTDIDIDYPYLTKDLSRLTNKSLGFVAKAAEVLEFKGNPKFHQEIRAGQRTSIHRYSEAAKSKLEKQIQDHPDFDPYGMARMLA